MKWFVPTQGLALAVGSLLACACATTAARPGPGPARVVHLAPTGPVGPGPVTHLVTKGQTLYRIALAYGVSVEQLMDANHIVDPRELKEGERLSVPGAQARKAVPAFDAPEPEPAARSTAAAPGVGPEKKPPRVVRVGKGSGALQWPLRGVLYARFGKKGNEAHDGVDLAAPAGQSVKVAAPGQVLFAGEQKGYGLVVIVEHEGGLITLYAHNRDLRVRSGQKVREGQVVATVGDSGRTSGPHLHFEVRKDGIPIDPLDYLGAVPPA